MQHKCRRDEQQLLDNDDAYNNTKKKQKVRRRLRDSPVGRRIYSTTTTTTPRNRSRCRHGSGSGSGSRSIRCSLRPSTKLLSCLWWPNKKRLRHLCDGHLDPLIMTNGCFTLRSNMTPSDMI
mmetsp:Transcript_32204/g.78541  ORF Transcript_32204/g.78541 Transcript_32204/m.78541 type:complete len:122 (-) Transcript_32204:558-923(-)